MIRYVFIVGLPRTGTKLVQNILQNASSTHIKISPETFFLGHMISPGLRQTIKEFGDMQDDTNARKLVDYLYSGNVNGTYWQQLSSGFLGVDNETFFQAIVESDRSDKGIYEAIMRVHTDISNGTILGDKTPGNLYHVPTLMEWFPNSKIIHTFRDPRAILASEFLKRTKKAPRNLRWIKPVRPLYHLAVVLHVTITWQYAVRLHHKYKDLYPNDYFLSSFEDLVSEPEICIKAICEFLDIEFDEQMLNPRRTGSSYERQGGSGIDKDTLTRWRNYLKPWMNAWLRLSCRRYLREFGVSLEYH